MVHFTGTLCQILYCFVSKKITLGLHLTNVSEKINKWILSTWSLQRLILAGHIEWCRIIAAIFSDANLVGAIIGWRWQSYDITHDDSNSKLPVGNVVTWPWCDSVFSNKAKGYQPRNVLHSCFYNLWCVVIHLLNEVPSSCHSHGNRNSSLFSSSMPSVYQPMPHQYISYIVE